MTRELGMLIVLVLACVMVGASNGDFYGEANLLNTTRHIAMLGIYALGMSFVVIAGGIDLSVGSVIGLTGVIIAAIASPSAGGGGIWAAISVALAVALATGLCQGLLITGLRLQPFIVTLGGMLLLRGVAQTICGGGTISFGASSFRDLADHGIIPLGNGYLLPFPVLVFLIAAAASAYLLHFTVFGRYVYAIGGNRDAAAYCGVPVKRVETLVYVIAAGLSGIAGIVYAAYIGQMSHTVGTAYELIAIAAVVLGGCSLRGGQGSVLGVVIGSALMKVIENGVNMFKITYRDNSGSLREWRLDTNWQYIVIGTVILAAIILDQLTQLLQEWRTKARTALVASLAAKESI